MFYSFTRLEFKNSTFIPKNQKQIYYFFIIELITLKKLFIFFFEFDNLKREIKKKLDHIFCYLLINVSFLI